MKQERIWIVILGLFAMAYALGPHILCFRGSTESPAQRKVQNGSRPNKNATPTKPAFQDYPAGVATGPFVPPRFNGAGDRYKKYRTAIKLAVSAGPNFAGHFTIVEVGCGTSCTIPFIVDLSDGKISEFPGEFGIIPDITYEYRRESTLLLALLPLDVLTSRPRCKKLYYKLISGHFVKIEESIAQGECYS